MCIDAIRTQEEYDTALSRIRELFFVDSDTEDEEELEMLIARVQAYEAEHYPVSSPDPVEAIDYYMESRGLSLEDVGRYVGGSNILQAVLQGEHPLTSDMIDRLEEGLDIPPGVLTEIYQGFSENAETQANECSQILTQTVNLAAYHNYCIVSERFNDPSVFEKVRRLRRHTLSYRSAGHLSPVCQYV